MAELMKIEDAFQPTPGVTAVSGVIPLDFGSTSLEIAKRVGSKVRVHNARGEESEFHVVDVATSVSFENKRSLTLGLSAAGDHDICIGSIIILIPKQG